MTEIRSPYYFVVGPLCIQDILEANGHFIDGLKFKGGSASLMPKYCLKEIADMVHWAEHLLMKGPSNDFLRLIRLIRSKGLKAKPQLDVRIEDANSLKDVQIEMDAFIKKAKRFLEDGADMIMFDADGITKGVDEWRTDLVAKMIGRLGLHPPFPPGISPYALVEV
ncbi:hypothetical protein L7F22_027871 [Adiantum nelumboides]|nr:hypothetical protein [Adiantum nelumboides]